MISLSNISFGYQDKLPVLQDLHLQIKDGDRICIMAPSGRGKTTLLRLLCQSLKPQSGEITGLDGKKISMVFQEDRLIENYSVRENIRLGCLRGMKHFSDTAKADDGQGTTRTNENDERQSTGKERIDDGQSDVLREHLSLVGLAEYADEKVSKLSGGMKRRVAIVRAILSESDMVIMDEPFSGIDQEKKKEVIDYIAGYLAGRTFIMVSHDPMDSQLLEADVITL